eukprot:249781_1
MHDLNSSSIKGTMQDHVLVILPMSEQDWDRLMVDQDYIALIYSCLAFAMVSVDVVVVFVYKLRTSNNNEQVSSNCDQHNGHIKVITTVAIYLNVLSALLCAIILTKWIFIAIECSCSKSIHSSICNFPYAYPAITAAVGMIFMIGYFVVGVVYLLRIKSNMKIRYNKMLSESDNNVTAKKDDMTVVFSLQTVNDTVRCAFLIMICGVSNLLTPLIIRHRIGQRIGRHATHLSSLVFGTFTDMICHTICIFLLFRFVEKYYFGMCKPCHRCRCNYRRRLKGYPRSSLKLTEKDCMLV